MFDFPLLELLVFEACILPEDVATTELKTIKLCRDCRKDLNTVPDGDPAKPMQRDRDTNAILVDADDHAAAYLECETHAKKVMNFILERHGVAFRLSILY